VPGHSTSTQLPSPENSQHFPLLRTALTPNCGKFPLRVGFPPTSFELELDYRKGVMSKMYVIQWKSKVNGRAGRGTKLFDQAEAERLVEELNLEYPQIHHEVFETSQAETSKEETPEDSPQLLAIG
jgi:hypothetical protein